MPATPVGRRVPQTVARSGCQRRRFLAGALAFAAIVSLGCKDNTTEPADVCDNIQDITIGVPVSGSLGLGDCRLSLDNSYADYWRLVLTATTKLQIDLTSTEFDAYIFLNSADGTNIEQADEGGIDNNARLTRTLEAGTYHVLANSFSVSGSGAYQLTVAIIP